MLTLMTFNIRYGTADDGANHWDNRKHLVLERIRACDPDLLGLQECRDDSQAEFIRENLPDYEFYGVPRGGGSVTALEMAPILFKRSATVRVSARGQGLFLAERHAPCPRQPQLGRRLPAHRRLGAPRSPRLGQATHLPQHPF